MTPKQFKEYLRNTKVGETVTSRNWSGVTWQFTKIATGLYEDFWGVYTEDEVYALRHDAEYAPSGNAFVYNMGTYAFVIVNEEAFIGTYVYEKSGFSSTQINIIKSAKAGKEIVKAILNSNEPREMWYCVSEGLGKTLCKVFSSLDKMKEFILRNMDKERFKSALVDKEYWE